MDIFNIGGSCDAAHDLSLNPKSLLWGWCLAFLEVNLQLSNWFVQGRREQLRYFKAHWKKNNLKMEVFLGENSEIGD